MSKIPPRLPREFLWSDESILEQAVKDGRTSFMSRQPVTITMVKQSVKQLEELEEFYSKQ